MLSFGERTRLGLNDEAGEIPPSRVLDDGDRGWLGRQWPGPPHGHVPDLWQPQLAVGQHLEPGVGGEPDRLPVIFAGPESRLAHLWPLPGAVEGGEEVPIGGVQVLYGLL